jgi:hypothetical protein
VADLEKRVTATHAILGFVSPNWRGTFASQKPVSG